GMVTSWSTMFRAVMPTNFNALRAGWRGASLRCSGQGCTKRAVMDSSTPALGPTSTTQSAWATRDMSCSTNNTEFPLAIKRAKSFDSVCFFGRMQTRRWFIQHVGHSEESLMHLGCQAEPLQLPGGQGMSWVIHG